jgi:hypothetical protein
MEIMGIIENDGTLVETRERIAEIIALLEPVWTTPEA